MVQSKSILGLLILIIVLVSGCINSNKPTPTKSFDYSTKLSPEEQKIVGIWNSQSEMTTFVFNTDRTGRIITRGLTGDDCRKLTEHDRNYCLDNGAIVDTYNWRIVEGRITIEGVNIDSIIVVGNWDYYITNENDSNELILRDFSGAGKDLRFLLTKVINLHAQQIILDDTEIKETLGANLTRISQDIIAEKNDDKIGHILSGISVVYGKHEYYIFENASIGLFVSPDFDAANKIYQSLRLELQKGTEKVISNKIDIGDYGELFSIVETKKGTMGLSVGESFIIFRKNNIIVAMKSKPDIKVETLFELARKQDAKISRILEMVN